MEVSVHHRTSAERKRGREREGGRMFSFCRRKQTWRTVSKAWISGRLLRTQLFGFKLRMPSSKAAPSHDVLLAPEDKRTVAKVPAECVVTDLDKMLVHSLWKAAHSALQVSLCLWRLRGPPSRLEEASV